MTQRFVWSLIFTFIVAGLFACGTGGNNSTPTNQGGSDTTYSIACSVTVNGVGLPGVTMTLSGVGTASEVTDANGSYTFSDLANGSYTMTPSKAGYVFQPDSKTVAINNANSTDNTFTATATATTLNSISGSVTLSGAALSGVSLVLSGASSTTVDTDASGNYNIPGLSNGSYTITRIDSQ